MKKKYSISLLVLLLVYTQSLLSNFPEDSFSKEKKEKWQSLVVSTKKLCFPSFPNAFNPSIAQTELGLLLTFRYCPDPLQPWISEIGIVRLDESLNPIGQPQVLKTRPKNSAIPSQSEDARIFSFNGKTYILYNDNMEYTNPPTHERRDMYLAQVQYKKKSFVLSQPKKLYHYDQYSHQKWQKNWIPFEWNGVLLLSYSLNPHDILYPNFETGKCLSIYKTQSFINWHFGSLRGGTPAILVDGEYLAFFHSSIYMSSPVSEDMPRFHYFMGAYTFSSEPPFNITKMTSLPIVGKEFYTRSGAEKRVIFPGGYAVAGPYLYVAYGKDDSEIWITTIDKQLLQQILEPVQQYQDLNEAVKDVFDREKWQDGNYGSH